jgi:hypothetical protein
VMALWLTRSQNIPSAAWKVLASTFWDQDGIIPTDYLPKGQTINLECYLSLLVNWRTLWRENTVGSTPSESCSSTTMPRLLGHLQPRRNSPTCASNVLITHPNLRIWPRRTTTCSLDLLMPPRRRSWTNNLLIFFFSGWQKLQQRAKNVLCFVRIPSLFASAFFRPGRAKNLLASSRKYPVDTSHSDSLCKNVQLPFYLLATVVDIEGGT